MNLKTNEKDVIAKEGYPFIAGGLVSACLFYNLNIKPLFVASSVFSAFGVFFFRNPKRKIPVLKNAVVSPADGKIVSIKNSYERYFFRKDVRRISVFMSLFDVHVNRFPVDGVVLDKVYKKGQFLAAFKEEASLVNEQSAMLVETECKKRIVVVQIAGVIARRIESYPSVGQKLSRGEIYGLIRFGSRLDVYIEDEFEETVQVNEKVKAGETILGIFR